MFSNGRTIIDLSCRGSLLLGRRCSVCLGTNPVVSPLNPRSHDDLSLHDHDDPVFHDDVLACDERDGCLCDPPYLYDVLYHDVTLYPNWWMVMCAAHSR